MVTLSNGVTLEERNVGIPHKSLQMLQFALHEKCYADRINVVTFYLSLLTDDEVWLQVNSTAIAQFVNNVTNVGVVFGQYLSNIIAPGMCVLCV